MLAGEHGTGRMGRACVGIGNVVASGVCLAGLRCARLYALFTSLLPLEASSLVSFWPCIVHQGHPHRQPSAQESSPSSDDHVREIMSRRNFDVGVLTAALLFAPAALADKCPQACTVPAYTPFCGSFDYSGAPARPPCGFRVRIARVPPQCACCTRTGGPPRTVLPRRLCCALRTLRTLSRVRAGLGVLHMREFTTAVVPAAAIRI